MENNPLQRFFRMPAIHIMLPSHGVYHDLSSIEIAVNGEIPIFPMTAADEITIKNPEGLLNGYAVEKLIESCIPGIQNVRQLPMQDVDVILLAIKLASYGDELHVSAECPHCKLVNEFTTSIRGVLSRVKYFEPEYVVRVSDEMLVELRPQSFGASTKINLASFEEMKAYQALLNTDITDRERSIRFNQSFEKIANLNLDVLVDNVLSITVPENNQTIKVTNPHQIREFIHNSDRVTIGKIREGVEKFKGVGLDKNVNLVCSNEECNHEWETEFQFDPSHFFA